MEKFIEQLIEVRLNPRKMRNSYLESFGLLQKINELVSNDFNNREKMDIIILGTYNKCYCGELSKPKSSWCSITCKNKDPVSRELVSIANTNNSAERLEKARNTRIERYGVSSVQDIPASKIKTKLTKQKYYNDVMEETFNKHSLDKKLLSDIEYLTKICEKSSLFEVWNTYFNGISVTTLIRHFERLSFDPGFRRGGSSNGEQELFNWLSSVSESEVLNNHRKTLGKELDIYIPEKGLAIEYHGLYWHSSKKLEDKNIDSKNYHLLKLKLANTHNINLLQFYEDEWLYKKNIVKSIILAKLNIFDKIYFARKTTIKLIDKKTSDLFLDVNHIQGKCVGKTFGLFDGEALISVMTVGKSRFNSSYELIRFATKLNCRVIGGFSKLLKYSKTQLGIDEITTYADLRYSTGETYKIFGKFIKQSEPGYFWVDLANNIRINRFNTQKHKLEKFLGDNFNPDYTEKQNMENAGYHKIYDCGNISFLI